MRTSKHEVEHEHDRVEHAECNAEPTKKMINTIFLASLRGGGNKPQKCLNEFISS